MTVLVNNSVWTAGRLTLLKADRAGPRRRANNGNGLNFFPISPTHFAARTAFAPTISGPRAAKSASVFTGSLFGVPPLGGWVAEPPKGGTPNIVIFGSGNCSGTATTAAGSRLWTLDSGLWTLPSVANGFFGELNFGNCTRLSTRYRSRTCATAMLFPAASNRPMLMVIPVV